MGSVLTDEWFSLQNFGVLAFIVLWFGGWTIAAKNMIHRTEIQKQEMMNVAAREIQAQKDKSRKSK